MRVTVWKTREFLLHRSFHHFPHLTVGTSVRKIWGWKNFLSGFQMRRKLAISVGEWARITLYHGEGAEGFLIRGVLLKGNIRFCISYICNMYVSKGKEGREAKVAVCIVEIRLRFLWLFCNLRNLLPVFYCLYPCKHGGNNVGISCTCLHYTDSSSKYRARNHICTYACVSKEVLWVCVVTTCLVQVYTSIVLWVYVMYIYVKSEQIVPVLKSSGSTGVHNLRGT